jgi:hypothetical protein
MHDPPLAIVLDKETDEPKETVQEDLEVNSQKQWGNELWTKGRLVLDKSSAQQAMKFFGRGSTWKSQGEISALQLALHCLSVRRVRSEVEAQLGKVEEQSIACNLTSSQSSHYRNAIAGFAASLNGTETMDSWFCFLLRLRSICNCVDLLNDLEKLSHADLRLLQSSSTKLDALLGQLTRFVSKEHKRVAIYCQLDSMFPVLEMFLGLLEITFVRVTGSKEIQQKALTHFALRGNVRVALASTRLSASSRAVTIYGADVIFVLDSDWNSVCDAKLRASWAKAAAVGRKDETQPLHIFRFHCENTIESSLMRVGACVLNEKVLSEVTPQELISVPEDLAAGMIFPISFEKPAWWKNVSGTSKDVTGDNIALEMSKAERSEKFCDEIETPILPSWEIDAEEHLLLSNTDELMPVEWYAVNFVHSVTDKRYVASTGGLEHEEHIHNDVSRNISFEEVSAVEVKNLWQSEEVSHMFYPETPLEGAEDSVLYKLMEAFRANNGMEPDYGLYQPPQPPLHKEFAEADPEMVPLYSHMQFRVAYRVPVPPPVKAKADSTGTEDAIKLSKLKKQKSTSGATGRPSSSTTAGLKRKLSEQQAPKEHRERVDFEGIPLPDVGSFEDDDFWGDTNLDALDSVSWDDASVLTGILGPSLDSVGTQRVGQTKKHKTSTVKTKKVSSALDSVKDTWTNSDDVLLKKLFEIYGANWTIISHVLNGSYSSRFFCKKRTPRQCYDRYGKVTSSGISTEKSDLLEICLVGRIGLPEKDSFLKYSERDSLPGLPPPSIANVPQVEDLALKNMCYAPPSALDGRPSNVAMLDLIPIKKSFEAIIQCMKRKSSTSTLPVASGSSDVSKSNVETPSTEVLIPPPHKSHTDMISLLPNVILSPNEVIKRGKEATVAAVQAAAVQAAGVSRDVSPLAATGDVILGAAFGSHAARKAQAAVGSNRITPISSGQPRTPTWGMDVASRRNSVGSTATTPTNAANVSTAQIATVTTPNSALGTPNAVAANPVTTSTLLYVIDRMPEIKNKIQVILNRSDVSESQKVAMIARLLNNSNAMSATASVTASTAAAAAATGASVGSLSPYPLDVIPSASASSLGTTPSTTPIPASSPLSGNSRPSSTSASPSSRPPKPSSSTPGST